MRPVRLIFFIVWVFKLSLTLESVYQTPLTGEYCPLAEISNKKINTGLIPEC
jgi:hypothetical protein